MKGVVIYVDQKYAQNLVEALDEAFIAYRFYSFPSKSHVAKCKIIVDSGDTDIHKTTLIQIQSFSEGFVVAMDDVS